MRLKFDKKFLKHFDKLPVKTQDKVNDAIEMFRENPRARALRNHRLTGQMKNIWSISAGGDIRIHYKKYSGGEIVIIFVDVGSHSQLY
jgi:addiction module RelE/StbE family toxin